MNSQVDTIPKTMKAWVAYGAGRIEDVLRLEPDWPTPAAPTAGEVLIRVSHVAINPGDAKMLVKPIPFRKTCIAGMDFSGEVVQVGPSPSSSSSSSSSSAAQIRVGTLVAGTVPMINILRGVGSLAEYLVVPAHAVVEVPDALDVSAAAGLLGIVGQTSVALVRAAGLKKGDTVLVNGASGGVASVLVQALHGLGVKVTGICSGKNVALVRRLGAEEVIDYTAHENLYAHLSSLVASPGSSSGGSGKRPPFDAIIDCVGDDTLYYRSPDYLKVDGKYHSIDKGPLGFLAQFKFNHWPVFLGGVPRTYSSVFSNPAGASARQVVDWFDKGYVKEMPIDLVFGFEDALKAFEKLDTKRAVGKILIKVA